MRNLAIAVILGASPAICGCASGVLGPARPASELRLLAETVTPGPTLVQQSDSDEQTPVLKGDLIGTPVRANHDSAAESPTEDDRSLPFDDHLAEAAQTEDPPAEKRAADATLAESAQSEDDRPPRGEPSSNPIVVQDAPPDAAPPDEPSSAPTVASDRAQTVQWSEEIVTPAPLPQSPFKPDAADDDVERLDRRIVDVPLDLRPTRGDMPDDLATAAFAGEATVDETWPTTQPADIFCSYTPWTICFRPLYFEDIKLERYGHNVGCLQSGLSGVRFFSQIAALPYKMTVRPPRSCDCSNGFSRPGDCPLPGYGHREFRWDASLIEAAAVAGVVYILP